MHEETKLVKNVRLPRAKWHKLCYSEILDLEEVNKNETRIGDYQFIYGSTVAFSFFISLIFSITVMLYRSNCYFEDIVDSL